jgi:minor extracellular serine protease Vpr
MSRRLVALVAAACLIAASLPAAAAAADPTLDPLPDSLAELALDQPARSTDGVRPSVLDRSLLAARGPKAVVIRLKDVPTATLAKKGKNAQVAQQKKIAAAQAAFEKRARAIDPKLRVLGRMKVSLNAVIAQVDAKQLAKLARDRAVASIRPVIDYQLDLSETVPYIGARALQNLGLTGTGIRVAVLDSGIDYTHAHMGGPGTALAYKNAYGVKTKDTKNTKINDAYKGVKLFPTARVVGGYDFVGESWPTGPLAPDPDPIDCGPGVIPAPCAGGHGTHVASIIGGVHGVAPSVKFYAVKVCSAVSTACSGVALLQGMDFALDPNRDGSTADAVDLVNMSLGSQYGQAPDDDLVASVENATAVGVLTVASAGNGGDKPYVTGTPAAAPSALSVAQTAVPSSVGYALFIHTSGGVVVR